MTEASGPSGAEANVRKARLSPVWVIPIVAIALAAYLGYRTLTETGPKVTVYFATADGIEVGKTKVKYKSVDIGTVTNVDVRTKKPQIVVTCQLDAKAGLRAVEGSQFWVVRPRIGAGGISGLGTLVSGAYVNFSPGAKDGTEKREFVGLENPPETSPDDPRLSVTLLARDLGSLHPESPVYYRQIQVGKIGPNKVSDDGKGVEIEVLIEEAHANLLRTDSRFWNAGGIEFAIGLGEANVHTESLAALLAGGVAFDSPAGSKPAEKDTKYRLHNSRSEVENAGWLYGGLQVVVEANRLGGVKEGDFVLYKEERVGSVVSTALSNDSSTVRVHLNILPRYTTLVRSNSVFWNASGISASLGLTGLKLHASSLESLIAGGVAFATPNSSGSRVKNGSVFELHSEVKDAWLEWSPKIDRGGAAQKHAAGIEKKQEPHGLAKFFHHEDKPEEETKAEDQPKDQKKHGFWHWGKD